MDISISATLTTPNTMVIAGKSVGGSSEDVTVVLHLDPDTQSAIAAALGTTPSTSGAPLTPSQLAAQYSASELAQALNLALAQPAKL